MRCTSHLLVGRLSLVFFSQNIHKQSYCAKMVVFLRYAYGVHRILTLNFMLIVRKEISGGESKLTTDDIMVNIMQSREEFHKFHEFSSL